MFRPWWLDVVCPNAWDVCLAFDKGGEVTGVLVYHLTKYRGFPIIKMPPLTDYSGLWLNYPDNQEKRSSRYTFDKQVSSELLAQLPPVAFYFQQWHPAMLNWLPFFWAGFRQTTIYTYRLPLKDETFLFDNLKAATRTHIRKASKDLQIDCQGEIHDLYYLVERSFERQQLHPHFSLEVLQCLDSVLKIKGLRQIYLARGRDGKIHAGAYVVWDEQCAYYLLSGADPELRESSALYLLLWRAIQDQIGKVQMLDFMGSILEPVERVFRSFGGELTPHFKIFKARNKMFQLLSILLNKDFY